MGKQLLLNSHIWLTPWAEVLIQLFKWFCAVLLHSFSNCPMASCKTHQHTQLQLQPLHCISFTRVYPCIISQQLRSEYASRTQPKPAVHLYTFYYRLLSDGNFTINWLMKTKINFRALHTSPFIIRKTKIQKVIERQKLVIIYFAISLHKQPWTKLKVRNQWNRNEEELAYMIDEAINTWNISSSHSEVLLHYDVRKWMY